MRQCLPVKRRFACFGRLPRFVAFWMLAAAISYGQAVPPEIPPANPDAEITSIGAKLEGVPEEVEGRIIDVTTVFAEREAFRATGAPSLIPYIAQQPKERLWNFPYTRPQQRRYRPRPPATTPPTALMELLPQMPGRLRYQLLLTGRNLTTHGAVFVNGESQNNAYTQERESLNDVTVGGVAGWEGAQTTLNVNARRRARFLNWIDVLSGTRTPSGAIVTESARVSKEMTLSEATLSGDHRPALSTGTRFRWSIGGTDYRLPHETDGGPAAQDRLTEARFRGVAELSWADRPIRVNLSGRYRRSEGTFPLPGLTDRFQTAMGGVSIEDRYVPFARGVLDWRIGVVGYRDPAQVADAEPQVRVRPPGQIGWTAALVNGLHFRLEGAYDVVPFPIEEIAARDFVIVNPSLPAKTALRARVAVWWSRARIVWGGDLEWRDVRGLPIWVETRLAGPLPQDAPAEALEPGIRVWHPEPVAARLLQSRAFFQGEWNETLRIAGEVRAEVADPRPTDATLGTESVRHLPYRPTLRSRVDFTWTPNDAMRIDVGADWVGSRYRTISEEVPSLDAYARIRARVSRSLSPSATAFIAGETAIGTYRRFESDVADVTALAQNALGIGIASRF